MRQQARFFRLLPCVFWLASSLTLADDIQLALQQADSGNFYLHGTLDQTIETDMLVDTGSGYVSLSRKTFNRIRQLPGTEYARDIHGTMANGHTLRIPIYRVHELALGESCVLRDIEVAVFPGADRDILGLNALRRMQPFTLQMDPPALIASQCANLELSMSQ